jgi:hypothetical protein
LAVPPAGRCAGQPDKAAVMGNPGPGQGRALDRPGDLGGSDPWEDAELCLHSGSTRMSCANVQ